METVKLRCNLSKVTESGQDKPPQNHEAGPARTTRSESNPFPAGRLRALRLPPLPAPRPRWRCSPTRQPNCYPRPPTINNLTPLPAPALFPCTPASVSTSRRIAINKSRCGGIAEISVILALLGCLSTTASLAHLFFSFSCWLLQLGVCFGWAGGSVRSFFVGVENSVGGDGYPLAHHRQGGRQRVRVRVHGGAGHRRRRRQPPHRRYHR